MMMKKQHNKSKKREIKSGSVCITRKKKEAKKA